MISSLQATRHMNLNSGLFYTQSNQRTIGLMDRIAARLAKEAAWDQSVFNEEIFFLSHDDYVSPNISVRVMNYQKVSESMRTTAWFWLLCNNTCTAAACSCLPARCSCCIPCILQP